MLSFVLKYKTSHVLAKIWNDFGRRNPNPHKSHVNSTFHRILVANLNKQFGIQGIVGLRDS